MQVSKVAHGGEALKWFGEKQIYSFTTPHIVETKVPRVMQSRFWLQDGVSDFAGLDFHTNFLRVKAI